MQSKSETERHTFHALHTARANDTWPAIGLVLVAYAYNMRRKGV